MIVTIKINTFYVTNLMHDIFFNLGFTKEKGNFQVENFSGKGVGKDPVTVIIHDYDFDYEKENYNDPVEEYFSKYCSLMCTSTPFDGQSPTIHITNMKYATANHGIIHEYTHALTQRMTTYGRNENYFVNGHSRELNEALSEFFFCLCNCL